MTVRNDELVSPPPPLSERITRRGKGTTYLKALFNLADVKGFPMGFLNNLPSDSLFVSVSDAVLGG